MGAVVLGVVVVAVICNCQIVPVFFAIHVVVGPTEFPKPELLGRLVLRLGAVLHGPLFLEQIF
jgi:hypothetical protein